MACVLQWTSRKDRAVVARALEWEHGGKEGDYHPHLGEVERYTRILDSGIPGKKSEGLNL